MSGVRLAVAGAIAAVLLLSVAHTAAAEPRSDASSTSATPVSTYISELGAAVSIGPHPAAELPPAGSAGDGPSLPAQALGFAMAAGGVALIYASRAMRPRAA